MTGRPLRQRPLDIAVIAYFAFNLLFISYLFDLEQIVIVDVQHFTYPAWPPRFVVDLSHWWGHRFDPSIMYASIMLTNVAIISSEEAWCADATAHLGSVIGANASWIVFPVLFLLRMWYDKPFGAKGGR
jgi:hypothetical protein